MKRSFFLLFFLVFLVFQARSQEQFALYFDSNKSVLKPSEASRLSKWMAENADVKIVAINGYTDEDGTSAHNDSLSQKRVEEVLRAISGKIKIRDDFKTRSFGESHRHSANKAENRRATIYYLKAADIPRENEILGIKTEAPKPKEVHYPDEFQVQNPDGTTSTYALDVEFMKKIGTTPKGEKLAIPDLNFVINTFAITNDSRRRMFELLLVMQQNPKLVIEIQGHLCCAKDDRTDLSTKRAKAVQQFLLLYGIEKSRLSYKGFGVSQSVFPIPEKSEAERAANRRVEIQIVSN